MGSAVMFGYFVASYIVGVTRWCISVRETLT